MSAPSRNTLGSTLALFSINEDATAELLAVLNGDSIAPQTVKAVKEDLAAVKEDESAKALELVKDAIVALTDREMENLAASVLRAMGYHARVTPIGPDRGVDVIASPDGLGLEEPRVKVEVKHRAKTAMGAQDVRNFISILRPGDRGLYQFWRIQQRGEVRSRACHSPDNAHRPGRASESCCATLRILRC